MGWFSKQKQGYKDTNDYYKLGCEILGRPRGNHGFGTPLERLDRVNAGKKEAARRAKEAEFGAGEAYGDRNWTAPVHATRDDGRTVTISFGIGPRAGETLVCDGHVSRSEFYERAKDGQKGHDHFLADGSPAGPHGDRGRFSD